MQSINNPPKLGSNVAKNIADLPHIRSVAAVNKFEVLAAHNAITEEQFDERVKLEDMVGKRYSIFPNL
jgi:fumarate hydratase class II